MGSVTAVQSEEVASPREEHVKRRHWVRLARGFPGEGNQLLPTGTAIVCCALPENHRITEGVRLEGTTVSHLVQPPCSVSVILEYMVQDCVQMCPEYLQ